MKSDEVFEAISHPLRIKILKLLAEKPRSFSELKRRLGITSSGKLDFHLKKLEGLVAVNNEGRYALTREGYAALQAIETIRRYGWQRRAYIIGTVTYIIAASYMVWKLWEVRHPIIILTLALATLWYAFYSYLSIVKRKVFKAH